MGHPAAQPDPSLVEAFWTEARVRSGLAGEENYLGRASRAVVPPPAWSYGESREAADAFCDAVLAGEQTATSGARWEFDQAAEPLPEVGALSVLCDGWGQPRALLRVSRVRVLPFRDVDAGHARAEGEGDLDAWRARTADYLAQAGGGEHPFTEDVEVVLEEFALLARA